MDVAAVVKQQMLGALIEALSAAAPIGAVKPGAPTAPGALVPGETIRAVVMSPAPAGGLNVQIDGRPVQAAIDGDDLPPQARQPGATLQLRVETAGQTPRLAFIAVETAPAAASSAPTAAARQPASAAGTPPSPSASLQRLEPAALALASATATAAARQASAAPLYANLAALAERADAPLPAPARLVARAILDGRLDAARPISADAVKTALAGSGVLAEALAARGGAPALDAKALLGLLRSLLAGGAAGSAAARPSPPDAEPPRRDGAVAAMRPSAPTLAADAAPSAIASTLIRQADQALERLTLHQLASLPDQRPADQRPADQRPADLRPPDQRPADQRLPDQRLVDQRPPADPVRAQQLSFEAPIAFGAQTALATVRIERERRDGGNDASGVGEPPSDAWGVRFALDADGLGPVHAHLRLSGDRIAVTIWAEEPATRSALIETVPLLEAALAESALDVADVAVMAGRPMNQKAGAGLFLDRTS